MLIYNVPMSKAQKPIKVADNVTMFSSDPIIYVVHNFISDEECDAFISTGKDHLKRSKIIDPNQDSYVIDNSRTSQQCWIKHNANEMLHEVSKRLSIMVQMPIRNAESFQLVYYTKGAEYQEHCDAFNYDLPEGQKHWEPGGQRMITALAYLNDVEDGGGTGFPKLDIEISPNKGDVLVFHNCIEGTNETNYDSLHAGLPVISGEKWAVNLWFRERQVY